MLASPLLTIPVISITTVVSGSVEGSMLEEPLMMVATPEDAGPRATYLSPPPILSPRLPSKLNSSHALPEDKKGLEKGRFEELLRASRERTLSSHKDQDLRKQVTVKEHNAKQQERRATFLAKLRALPSPTAVSTPVTPPESPAEFHFTLPSPGLASPLALFEKVGAGALAEDENGDREDVYSIPRLYQRIERIDYSKSRATPLPTSPLPVIRVNSAPVRRLPIGSDSRRAWSQGAPGSIPFPARMSSIHPPSLSEITARITSSTLEELSSRPVRARSPIVTAPSKPRPTFPTFLLERSRLAEPVAPPSLSSTSRQIPFPPRPRPKSADATHLVPALPRETGTAGDYRVRKGNEMMQRLKRRLSAPDVQPLGTVLPGGF